MAGKLSPEGEWSSGITPPPNPLENGPPGSPSSCLIQVSPTTALVIVQQPGQRLFGAHSVLIQGSARDTEAQGELLQLGQGHGTESGLLQTQGARLLAAAPSRVLRRKCQVPPANMLPSLGSEPT